MKTPVNIYKILPPDLTQVLCRPRLLNLLEQNKDKKLILILGQAAQGKTTLALSYLKTSTIPSAWVNLDKEDSDPINLFHLITQSLQRALNGFKCPAPLSYPFEIMGSQTETPFFPKWTSFICEQIPLPFQIVIDGLDRLLPDAPAFQFLQAFIENSPATIRLIILSRHMPPLTLKSQYLKVTQRALIITNQDLAFNQEEIKEFFRKMSRISFTADQLKKIHLATEGWIGGLILLYQTLSRYSEDSMTKYISEELPDHFRAEVFQYFGEEIFSSQSEGVQKFLVKSSVFDLIEPRFIKNLPGMENAEEILREVTRTNLFIQSVYSEEKGWLFRYHQLFRNFLKARFQSEIGSEEQHFLLLEAANLYVKRNEFENAVKCFLSLKAYDEAVPLIEHLGMDLLRKGRAQELYQWIIALPEDIQLGSAWLLFCRTMTRRFIAGKENILAFYRAYTLFKQKGDTKGILLSLAQLIGALIFSGVHLIPLGPLIKEAESVLQSLDLDRYQYERALLWCYLGLGLILGEGNIRKGVRSCQTAYLIAKQLQDIYVQANALNFSLLGLIFLGEFSLAHDACKKVEKLIQKTVYSSTINPIYLTARCLLAKSQGDFREVKSLTEKLQAEIERFGFIFIEPWVYEVLGSFRLFQREFKEAEEIAKSYCDTAQSLENAFFEGLALRMLGLIYFRQGQPKRSKKFFDQSKKALSETTLSKYHLNRVKLAIGLVCTHQKEYERAEKELGDALQYFSSILSYNSLAETHLVFALLKKNQGKDDEAIFHLQHGFGIARSRQYGFFHILGREDFTRVCLLTLELKVEEVMDYAARLLPACLPRLAEGELKKLSNSHNVTIREKAWEIRRSLHRSGVPRLYIKTLGEFSVFRGNSLMDEKEWDRAQPKQLLKAILSHGGQKVHKETLLDDLWQEEWPEAAETSLRTTLRRLRKSLEPAIDKEFGSSYLHFHDNLVFLDDELCHVDASLFLHLFEEGKKGEREGNFTAALSSYNDATELYKGDFLPGEVSAPYAEAKREDLKRKYIDILKRMGSFYEKQGALKKAIDCQKKAIQADPILEESYQKLMTLYFNKGKLSEALRVYEDCVTILRTAVQTKPDPMTIALYNKIIEKTHSALR